jgi:tRNA threonylcarbamoyladenosine biosynthesis protein TsaB
MASRGETATRDSTAPRTLLAFDTATERVSIALAARGRTYTHEGEGGARSSADFLPAVLRLLAQAGIGVRDLDAIAFGRGPGAFTGLRIACSVAQGLAFGAGKPVLPLDTLLAVAEDARRDAASLRVWAVMDARMDEIYAAEYAFEAGAWRVLAAPMLATPASLHDRWRSAPPEVVAGNALGAFAGRLDTGAARRVEQAQPRAEGMLALGRALWAAGGAVDAAQALPLYVRDKVAQTTEERAARAAP